MRSVWKRLERKSKLPQIRLLTSRRRLWPTNRQNTHTHTHTHTRTHTLTHTLMLSSLTCKHSHMHYTQCHHSVMSQVVDEAKSIMEQNDIPAAKKKMRVRHYEALLIDFGVSKSLYSEERGGKTVRFKQKEFVEFFWSRDDVVDRYHTYEEGDSETSFEDASESDIDDSFDSDDWTLDNLNSVVAARKRRRK